MISKLKMVVLINESKNYFKVFFFFFDGMIIKKVVWSIKKIKNCTKLISLAPRSLISFAISDSDWFLCAIFFYRYTSVCSSIRNNSPLHLNSLKWGFWTLYYRTFILEGQRVTDWFAHYIQASKRLRLHSFRFCSLNVSDICKI